MMINKKERNKRNNHNSLLIWFTGLPCSGKTTLAKSLEKVLFEKGYQTFILDGDHLRSNLNKDLSFSKEDREENLRRVAEISHLLIQSGSIVLASFVSPYIHQREAVSNIVGKENFYEIFINTPLKECIRRDVKGMYAKAIEGIIKNFTGLSDPYETPTNPYLEINTIGKSIEETTNIIYEKIKNQLINE